MNATDVINEFRRSGKRHIFITGSKSMGKSTLCKELSSIVQANVMTTKAIYEDNIQPEYVQIQSNSKSFIFAYKNKKENKFIINKELFNQVAVTFLNDNKNEWLSIDEIGYLERDMNEYNNLLLHKLNQNHFILTLRKDKKTPLLDYLRSYEDAYIIDLDNQIFDVSCIIMASGSGSRFGSNKLLADFKGKTLMEHIINQIPFELFKEVFVVTRYSEVEDLAKDYPVICIRHDLPRQSNTIKIGMNHITNTKGCMFVTCDQPLRTMESIKKLLLSFNENQESIVRLCYQDVIGNPVLFPSIYYEEIKNLKPGEKGSTVIQAHRDNVILVEANHKYELADVYTPDDLKQLSNIAD